MQLHPNSFIKRAGEAGIALRASGGDSIYFYTPERVVVALSLCGSALMFVGWLGGVWCV